MLDRPAQLAPPPSVELESAGHFVAVWRVADCGADASTAGGDGARDAISIVVGKPWDRHERPADGERFPLVRGDMRHFDSAIQARTLEAEGGHCQIELQQRAGHVPRDAGLEILPRDVPRVTGPGVSVA